MNKLILPVLLTAIVAGGGGFYGGMQYEKAKAPAANSQFAAFQGQSGARTGRGGAGAAGQFRNGAGIANGTITAKDANSITLSLRTGGSRVIFYSTSTTIGKMTTGSAADLANGDQIIVVGTPNSDGSVVASSIQIRPAGEPGGLSMTPPPAQNGNTQGR